MKKQVLTTVFTVALCILFCVGCNSIENPFVKKVEPKFDFDKFQADYDALKAKPPVEPVTWLTAEEHTAAQAQFDEAQKGAVAALENSRVMPVLNEEYQKVEKRQWKRTKESLGHHRKLEKNLKTGFKASLNSSRFRSAVKCWDDLKQNAPLVHEYLNQSLECIEEYVFMLTEVDEENDEAKDEMDKANKAMKKGEVDKAEKHQAKAAKHQEEARAKARKAEAFKQELAAILQPAILVPVLRCYVKHNIVFNDNAIRNYGAEISNFHNFAREYFDKYINYTQNFQIYLSFCDEVGQMVEEGIPYEKAYEEEKALIIKEDEARDEKLWPKVEAGIEGAKLVDYEDTKEIYEPQKDLYIVSRNAYIDYSKTAGIVRAHENASEFIQAVNEMFSNYNIDFATQFGSISEDLVNRDEAARAKISEQNAAANEFYKFLDRQFARLKYAATHEK